MALICALKQQGLLATAVAICCVSAAPVSARDFPHRAEVIKIEDLNHNIRRVTLKPQSPEFKFAAGQYIYLRAPDAYIDAFNEKHKTDHGEISRPYSFASSPENRDTFALIIKHYGPPRGKEAPPGVVSTYVHKHLKIGDKVELSTPRGRLYTPDDSDRPIVLLAGGVGISPFVGLLTYFFENKVNEDREIYLFCGVRSRQDLVLDAHFKEWAKTKKNFHYIPALSHPAEGDAWKGKTGYINLVFDAHFPQKYDADAYIAGSPIMVRETIKVLKKKGIPTEQIHRDRIKVGEDD